MKKHHFLLLILLIFGTSFSFAQASQNPAFVEVCELLASHKITKGSFDQTKVVKKISREIKSSGFFLVSADDGLLWKTQKPFISTTAITKNGIIQTGKNGKKSIISSSGNVTFEQVSSLMTSLFNGDAESLDKNFEIEFIGSKESWNINLIPKDSSVALFIKAIEMSGTNSIDIMILNEPTGDFTKYEFSNQIFPDSLTSEELSAFTEK